MKIAIIVPTYNEAENIRALIPQLKEIFKKIPHEQCHLVIVDGNSPDGTGDIVKAFVKNDDNIHLLPEKEKSGLGAAYTYGFKFAIEKLFADVVIEMDADFQHDPKEIPNFVEKIQDGYDYVIGSRFIKGGSIPKEWSFKRKFFSKGGSLFSKLILGIREINDFTSGYKASRVKNYLEKIDLDLILSKGFAYKIDLLYRMHKLGAKTVEIPIQFGLRDRGDSKMEKDNFGDSLKVVLRLRLNENKAFVKFLAVGLVGLFTDVLLFNLFRQILFPSHVAVLFSGGIAMLVTYTLNNIWSFKERKISGLPKLILLFLLYAGSSTIPIFVRSQLVLLFINAFGDTFIHSNTGFFIGIILGLIWNFTVYSKIIWKKTKS